MFLEAQRCLSISLPSCNILINCDFQHPPCHDNPMWQCLWNLLWFGWLGKPWRREYEMKKEKHKRGLAKKCE